MACTLKHKKAIDNSRDYLEGFNVIRNSQITNPVLFNKLVEHLRTESAKAYGVDEVSWFNDNGKLIPNTKALSKIDEVRKKLGLYEGQLASTYSNKIFSFDQIKEDYFEGKIETTVGELLDRVIELEKDLAPLAEHLKNQVPSDRPVYLERKNVSYPNAGEYLTGENSIKMYGDVLKYKTYGYYILHEVVHMATKRTIILEEQLKKEGEQLLYLIKEKLFEKYQDNPVGRTFYGLENVYEMLAEGLTNFDFVKELESIPYNSGTLLDKLLDYLSKLLNISNKDNLYVEFIKYYNRVIDFNNSKFPEYESFEYLDDAPLDNSYENLFGKFETFAKNLNPNFKIEVLEDLLMKRGVDAIADIRNFTIKIQKGKEQVVTEEFAHFYIELLPDKILEPMLEEITRTRLYKKVVEDYKQLYGNDYARLKREASAKLLAYYLEDPNLAKYWSGSDSLWENVKRAILKVLNWIKGKKQMFAEFVLASQEMLEGDTSRLDFSKTGKEMYAYDPNSQRFIQSLGGIDIRKYDKIFININDTLFDYQRFPGSKKKKRDMLFTGTGINEYYSKVLLTPLAKELRDKKDLLELRDKITLFTDLEVNEALLMRMREIFGKDVEIVKVTESEYITDDQGNLITIRESNPFEEKLAEFKLNNPESELYIIDNRFKSYYTEVDHQFYDTTGSTYKSIDRQIAEDLQKFEKGEWQKELLSSVEDIVQSDVETFEKLLKKAFFQIRTDLRKIDYVEKVVNEFGEEEMSVFEDEFGTLTLPIGLSKEVLKYIKKSDYETATLKFVEVLKSVTRFFANRNKTNFDSIKLAVARYELKGDIKQLDLAIFELNKFQNMVESWTKYMNVLEDFVIRTSPNAVNFQKIFAALKSELSIADTKLRVIALNTLAQKFMPLFEGYNKNLDIQIEYVKSGKAPEQFKDIKVEELESLKITEKKIQENLMGEAEDIPAIKVWLKTASNIEDPIVGGLATFIKRVEAEAEVETVNRSEQLMKAVSELNYTREDLDQIIVEDKHYEFVDGENKLVDTLSLLNPYRNLYVYEERFKAFQEKSKLYFKSKNENLNTPESDAEFVRIKDEWDSWQRANFYSEFTDEYYQRYNDLIKTPEDKLVFEKIADIQLSIMDEINQLREQLDYSVGESYEEANEYINDKLRELRQYRSDYYSDGVPKEGEDLAIAKMFQEKTKIDNEVYEFVTDKSKFISDVEIMILSLRDPRHKQMGRLIMDRLKGKESFETIITEIWDILNSTEGVDEITEWFTLNTLTRFTEEFFENRRVIFEDLDTTNKDLISLYEQYGYPADQVSKFKDMWQKLFSLTSPLRDERRVLDGSMATPQVQQLIKNLQQELSRIGLDKEDFLIHVQESSLGERAKAKKVLDSIIARQKALLGMLGELQSKKLTRYYKEEFVHQAQSTGFSDLFKERTGMSIMPGVNIVAVMNNPVLKNLLAAYPAHPFVEWFNRNHFEIEVVRNKEKSLEFTPTYLWKEAVANDPSFVKRIPGHKYTKREIKEKFKTAKNDSTWDSIERRWLPKSSAFFNPEYQRLKSSTNPVDQKRFKLLTLLTNFHRETQLQDGSPVRLGYRLPRVALNSSSEFVAWAKNVPKMLKDSTGFFEKGEDNFNESDSPEKKGIRSFFNTSVSIPGYDHFRIATPFTRWMPKEQLTKETVLSFILFAGGISRSARMVNINSLFRITDRTLTASVDRAKSGIKLTASTSQRTGNKNRLDAFRFLVANQIYGYNKAFELGKSVDKVVNGLKGMNTYGALGPLGVMNVIKNNIQGTLQNLINASFYNWSSPKSMRKAYFRLRGTYPKYMNDSTKPLSKRGVDYFIISFFNPALSESVLEVLGRDSNSLVKSFQANGILLFNQASEFGISASLLYAHLYHVDVERNGQRKKLIDILVGNEKLDVQEGWTDVRTGKPIDIDYLMNIKTAYRSVQEYVQGRISDKTLLSTTTLGSTALYFRNWLIPMLRRRFGRKTPNFMLGETPEGYWVTTFNLLKDYITQGMTAWHTLTLEEQKNVYTSLREFMVALASSIVIAFVFGFDVDDEDKFEKIKEKSWAFNTLLLLALQTKGETDSLSPIPFSGVEREFLPPILSEGKNIIQNPFYVFKIFNNYIKLINATLDVLVDADGAYYENNYPAYNIEAGDLKLGHYLKRILPWDRAEYLMNPEGKIQSYISAISR